MEPKCDVGSEPSGADGLRILLIEDEPSVARLTQVLLNSAGYSVQLAGNHTTASELLTQNSYHLILADSERGGQTPELAGLAALVATARCPVVLFTAHRFTDAQIQAIGFAGVVRKPYDIDDLLGVVREALGDSAPNGNNMTTTV
jgi:DNA-binding NtrC family response regulator